MKTLVFGAKGQLGRDLAAVFGRDGECVGADLPEVDIAEPGAAAKIAREVQPAFVINAAAYTDVEGAEEDRNKAWRVNVEGARRVAEAALAVEAPVVYISTDFVFDGRKTVPYEPDDPPGPLSVYAESKAAGEQATLEANPRHFIVRTAWLFGPGGNNFAEKMLGLAETRSELRVVDDEIGCPTHSWDLAEALQALAAVERYGIYHAVNAGSCSRFEFAQAIFRNAGLEVKVHPCSADEYPTKAARPRYSVLNPVLLEEITGYRFRPWEDALRHYLQRRGCLDEDK
ncbi:MAG: dTDP-4-dehydrorhamnose reductase [Candidatus Hydrogenedentota bacterium]